jgi:hypothetical protein
MNVQLRIILFVLFACASSSVIRAQTGNTSASPVTEQSQPQLARSNFLMGTYREKDNRDEELARKILTATAHLDNEERNRQANGLLRVLKSSQIFSIEQYGTTIIFNYPDGTRMPFDADGKTRSFRATRDVTGKVRAELRDDLLIVDLMWPGGERLRLIYENSPSADTLIFTRVASNSMVPTPVSIKSEYERVSKRGTRKFSAAVNQ